MPDYILHGGGVTQSASVEAVLAELGLDYEVRPVDIVAGEHRAPDFRALNPAGFVPALETPDGDVLHENAGIMLWLADRHPGSGLAPAVDAPERGVFLTRLMFLNNDIQSLTKTFFYPHRWSTEREDAPKIREKAFENVLKRWAIYDNWLAEKGPYALGDTFTIADIYATLWAAYGLRELDDIVSRCPAVARCSGLVLGRPKTGPVINSVVSYLKAWRDSRAKGDYDRI